MAEIARPESSPDELKKAVDESYYRILELFKFNLPISETALKNTILFLRYADYSDKIISELVTSGRLTEEFFRGKKRYFLSEPKQQDGLAGGEKFDPNAVPGW